LGIVVPANAIDPDDRPADFLERAPMGADYFTFRTAAWWATHWSRTTGISITSAEMLTHGHELWHQHHRASAAFEGTPLEETGDEVLLRSEHGQDLGFARITAQRTDGNTLRFGPGRFTTRIA
jgi:hypothetical protein